jgi:hypothetical protein
MSMGASGDGSEAEDWAVVSGIWRDAYVDVGEMAAWTSLKVGRRPGSG